MSQWLFSRLNCLNMPWIVSDMMWFLTSIDRYLVYALLRHILDNRTVVWKSLARITVQCEKNNEDDRREKCISNAPWHVNSGTTRGQARIEEEEKSWKNWVKIRVSIRMGERRRPDGFLSSPATLGFPTGMSYDNSSSSHQAPKKL